MDANANARVDSSEYPCGVDADGDGNLDDTCGDPMDYTYGWTCRDLTATQTVILADAVDSNNDGDLEGVWDVCEGLTGA